MPSEVHIKVGKNIRRERKNKKITIKQLAAGVGVNYSMISLIENGKTKINLDLLFEIAKFLDVPVYKLTGEAKEEFDKYITKENITSLEGIQRVLQERKDEKWYFEGEELPKELVEELRNQISTLIEIKKYELKKRQPK